jgi:hypothetical protein
MKSDYKIVEDAVLEIIEYLKKNHNIEEVRIWQQAKVEVGEGSVTHYVTLERSFGGFLSGIKIEKIIDQRLAFAKKCVNVLKQHKGFNPRVFIDRKVPDDEITEHTYNGTLHSILNNYFNTVQEFRIDKSILKEIYQEFDIRRNLEQTTEFAFIPLSGFNMKANRFDVSEEVYVEKMTAFDYNYIVSPFQDAYNDMALMNARYKLCTKYSYPQGQMGEARKIGKEKLKNAITALRLTKEGVFYPIQVYFGSYPIARKYYFNDSFSTNERFEIHAQYIFFWQYELRSAEFDTVITLFNKLSDIGLKEKLQPLKIGIEKFNQSYSRGVNWEDKILDYVTCIDSSVLYKAGASNYYKLSVRCALLLGGKLGVDAFSFSHELTNIRHRIIHNGDKLNGIAKENIVQIGNDKYGVKEFVDQSEQMARLVLIEYLYRIQENIGVYEVNYNMEKKFFGGFKMKK